MYITLMTLSDYNDVYTLWTRTAGMGLRSLDDSEDGIKKFLLRNPNTNFVCKNDAGDLIGVMMCGHDGRRAYIYHASVDEAYRKNGIATQLLEAVVGALKEVGIHKAALVVFKQNQLGNEFWQSQGFIERDDLVYRNKSLNEGNQ